MIRIRRRQIGGIIFDDFFVFLVILRISLDLILCAALTQNRGKERLPKYRQGLIKKFLSLVKARESFSMKTNDFRQSARRFLRFLFGSYLSRVALHQPALHLEQPTASPPHRGASRLRL